MSAPRLRLATRAIVVDDAERVLLVRFDFGDVMLRTDRHRAERPRMGVRHPLVIHRHVEETGGAERFALGLDLLEVPAERFLPLIQAEDRLERRRPC